MREFHLALSNMIALILQTKDASGGWANHQIGHSYLSEAMDAEDLCKLDIGQDYIYYLALIGPTLTWGP